MGFMVDKAAIEQVSEYFCFTWQALHRLLHTHLHPSSSGVGTIGHIGTSVIVE
jgi:hypothetical protein